MVLSRYRILQTKDEQGRWTDTGAVYERTYHDSPLVAVPVAGAGDVKVNWREWDDITAREREFGAVGPPLEEYDKVFVDHADRYRLSEEICTIEGDSYKEIRAKLYQRYVLDPMRECEETEHPVLTYEVLTEKPLAAARAIRETKGNEPCPSD